MAEKQQVRRRVRWATKRRKGKSRVWKYRWVTLGPAPKPAKASAEGRREPARVAPAPPPPSPRASEPPVTPGPRAAP